MEPADLKPDSPEDAAVDAWLRANSTVEPLRDDGFSERVLTALPAEAPSPRPALRSWLCAGGAIAGCLFAFAPGRSESASSDQLITALTALRAAFAPLGDSSVIGALVVAAISIGFVYRRELTVKMTRRGI